MLGCSIHGAEAVKIPLYRVYWDEDDVEAVTRVIRRGGYWTLGPEIREFERMLAEYLGVEYAVTFNSGTSALHAVMLAYGLRSGDEVIVPSFTFIATANAPLFVGAKPVFADIEEERYALDPADVVERITHRTKVIMPIHYGGMPAKIRELKEIAEDHGLILIEDMAESLGARTEEGRMVGTYGDAAVISFCGNKVITTGEGGAVVTNDKRIYNKLLLIRSHGRLDKYGQYFSSSQPFEYVTLGYNWRMSSITAAVGITQLRKIEKVVEMRRKVAQLYEKLIEERLRGLVEPFREPRGTRAVYQMYTVRFRGRPDLREEARRLLQERGVTTKVYFDPVHKTKFYRSLGYGDLHLPVTETVSKEVLTLPIYPTMTREEVEYVVNTIAEALGLGADRA